MLTNLRARVGSEAGERDHLDIFRKLSSLRSVLRGGVAVDVARAFAVARRAVEEHFASEEREMLASRYPYLPVHRAAHTRLARELRTLEQDCLERRITGAVAVRVLDTFAGWFDHHAFELDGQLTRYLRTQDPRARIAYRTEAARTPDLLVP